MEKLQIGGQILSQILDAKAEQNGSRTLVKLREGEISVGEVKAAADRLARGLAAHGVAPGDHVAVMLPNGANIIYVLFALARIGAVMVPINPSYRGELLRHVLDTSDSSVMIVTERLAGQLRDLKLRKLRSLIVAMDSPGPIGSLGKPAVTLSRLLDHTGPMPVPTLSPDGLQAIMYTSGTTGPSKGVMVSHTLALTCAVDSLHYLNSSARTIYCPLPLFHAAGLWDGVMAALIGDGAIAVVERFSATRFWQDIRRFNAQVAMGVFAMIPILLKAEPRADDLDNPLESFYMGKSALDDEFYERFGAHTVETYTSTEVGIGTGSPYGEWRTGSCGRVSAQRYEACVMDEHDRILGPGQSGELCIRPRQPWVMFSGYYGCPEATARAFRNLWFHTGDRVSVDEDGYFYFVDRISQAIRRRGENISAFELERAINHHSAVLESAAFGVPSELGDEDVAVVVVPLSGHSVSAEEIAAHCEACLPGFMVPRYIEIAAELPRSSTGKLAKHELKARGRAGVTPTTWDREHVLAPRRLKG